MSTQEKRTFCRVCEPACGMIAEVDGGELVGLKPDKDHPITKGFVCHKGIYGLDIHNDPDRLNVPLRRVAPGKFEEVSWDEALSDIAARLRAILETRGPSAVAGYRGNPSAFNTLFGPAFAGFFGQMGGIKIFSSATQDAASKHAGGEAVFGSRTIHPVPDIENTDMLLIFGENPAVSHMTYFSIADPMGVLRAAEERGARIVYINPREIESARFAGSVLKIKPDTDAYLMAAMIHEIDISVGFDEDVVARHGRGIDELREFVAGYPAERVAGITGIAADAIKALARDFASADSAAAHMATGVNMGRQGALAYWLLNVLVFVTGNLGRKGGSYFSKGFYERSPGAGRSRGEDGDGYLETSHGQVRKPGGVGVTLPGNLIAEYIEDPADPIKAMVVNGGNPLLSIGGEDKMAQAFSSLDLLVVVDIYRNATAEYADYILPAAGALEREDINIVGIGMQHRPFVQYTDAVVPPQFERKPEWWIYAKLAQAMGFGSVLDDGETPDLWGQVNAMLKSRGHSMDALIEEEIIVLEPSRPEAFFDEVIQTEDQRVDCFPEMLGASRERMAAIFAELDSEARDQLKLITLRDAHIMNTWYANLPKMKGRGRDRNFLHMHPDDAGARQLKDGAAVAVRTPYGAREIELKLTDEMMPGVVAINHGWGHANAPGLSFAQKTPGVNANALLPSGPGSFDPFSNQAHMTGIRVEVSAAP